MSFSEFFQGPDGENSSKRLAGILSTFLLLILAFSGGIVFLMRNDPRSFLEILDTISLFATGALGLGVFDLLFKKRYDKNNSNSISS